MTRENLEKLAEKFFDALINLIFYCKLGDLKNFNEANINKFFYQWKKEYECLWESDSS